MNFSRCILFVLSSYTLLSFSNSVSSQTTAITPVQREFFESKIRPVLVDRCYSCHNSTDTAEGGLILDHRDALLQGGQSGPPLNFKTPSKSLLLQVLRHEIADLEMPQGEDQLSKPVLKDIEKWISIGAPDPRVSAPDGAKELGETGWDATLKKRKERWSFQPITQPPIPVVAQENWSSQPVDLFILQKLEEKKLKPAALADKNALIRRLSYILRGLPPTMEETEGFLNDPSDEAYERLVDQYLASPAFGEHWARHFMDLVRYAETHGSEGDPSIPHAWKYRDYLIRALNDDVSYKQILVEHIAGDLLQSPRINEQLNINESAIAPTHWRMCFHGFAPTDALDEKVRFTDDQINVFSKTFLALTVSCARCHNHKFDPISQADYYALFGIVGSTRPGIVDLNPESIQDLHKVKLAQLKKEIRNEIGQRWTAETNHLSDRISNRIDTTQSEEISSAKHLLYPFHILKKEKVLRGAAFSKLQVVSRLPTTVRRWDFRNDSDFDQWYTHGNGTADHIAPPGQYTIPTEGDSIGELLSGGVYSHLLSTKHRNVFSSPQFKLDGEYDLWVKVCGDSGALFRYVVHDYPRNGTVYPVTNLQGGKWKWQRFDLSYWNGEEIHLEITTAADSAVLAKNVDRSWFGIQQVLLVPQKSFDPPGQPPAYSAIFQANSETEYQDQNELIGEYASAIRTAVQHWQNESATEQEIALLQEVQESGLLPDVNTAKLQELIKNYREMESEIVIPNRIAGVLEADAADQALYIRGNHRQPGASIPRRFLEVFDAKPYNTEQSGRYQLAMDLVNEDNPLTSRVIVNRLWHYVFGSGLVRTVDNFGHLGEQPSHPELLDYLAREFKNSNWSLKQLIRELVLSKTFRLSVASSSKAKEIDPENRLLSHANIRRLTGEEIRDTLLVVSNRIDRRMYGPPVGNTTNNPRRSIYLSVRRNSLNPFLETFDFPTPFATKGRRDVTNVPAQSLTMLNDDFVSTSAESLIQKLNQQNTAIDRIQEIFERSLTRSATSQEVESALEYVSQLEEYYLENTEKRTVLNNRIAEHQLSVSNVSDTVRAQVMEEKKIQASSVQNIAPPIAEWNFESTPHDTYGQLHGKLHGNAKIVEGGLLLDGKSYFQTPPLKQDLREKSLEVIAKVQDLNQRGGGLLTVQDLRGVIFDAVVYGEQQSRHWIAGSNNFARTQSFQGTEEDSPPDQPVHIVITYASDGKICCYRNGQQNGKEYQSNGPIQFSAGDSQVLIGLRHGSPVDNRLFSGKILAARLYDRALSAEEVSITTGVNRSIITENEIRSAMTAAQRETVDASREQIQLLTEQLKQLGAVPQKNQGWIDFTHAIFNLKEFIYIR